MSFFHYFLRVSKFHLLIVINFITFSKSHHHK